MKKVFLIACATLWAHLSLLAGVVPQEKSAPITGPDLMTPYGSTVVHDKYFLDASGTNINSTTGWNFVGVQNAVTLRINQETINDCAVGQFTASIDVTIKSKTVNGTTLPDIVTTLAIDYDNTLASQYREKHSFTFQDAYWVKVEINAVNTSLPGVVEDYILVESTLDAEYYYNVDVYQLPTFTTAIPDAFEKTIDLHWDPIMGAEEYDLEWTWIDNYDVSGNKSLADLQVAFQDNATRVTLPAALGTSYTLTPAYEQGYLVCRIRAVGKTGAKFTHRVEGMWSSDNYLTVNDRQEIPLLGTFTSGKDMLYIGSGGIFTPLEPTFNWQYSSTFAEEGKKKEVISYFDGSLRNRQSVTRLNTENRPVVGEQVYDHQGRPAVNILPVPDMVHLSLDYRHHFNRPIGSNYEYTRDDFDEGNNCSNTIKAMRNDYSYGASNYYSPQNTLAGNKHYQYIANAFNYPFTVTEYTPDNTGRISRQGGVGITHQLNSGHETKYFYATPEQKELDQLFGTNVGYKDHYEKEMVIDPNGQVSISYKNSGGQVVATALAGDPPSNVNNLASSNSVVTVTDDILEGQDLTSVNPDGSTVVTKAFVVPVKSTYTVDYSINIPSYTQADFPNACADCVYQLELSLTDECGNEYLDGDPHTAGNQAIVRTLGKPNIDYDLACNNATSYSFSIDPDMGNTSYTTDTLPIGRYTLSKVLRIDENAVAFYAQHYMENATGLQTEQSFIDNFLSRIDTTKCGMTCEECYDRLGTETAFVAAETAAMQAKGLTVDSLDAAMFTSMYNTAKAECDLMCEANNSCEVYRRMLIADVTPPNGQYAEVEEGLFGTTYFDALDLNPNTNTVGFNYRWRTNAQGQKEPIVYADAQGNPLKRSVWVNGEYKTIEPNEMTPAQFYAAFDEEIADSLITGHPEYCQYLACKANLISEEFDALMLSTSTYADAEAAGYLDPLNIHPAFANGSDPFFASGLGASLKTQMQNTMNSFEEVDGNCSPQGILSMWDLPPFTYTCEGKSCSDLTCLTALNIASNGWNNEDCEPYLDMMWQMFRAAYLQEKRKLVESLSNYNCVTTSFTTGKEDRIPSIQSAFDLTSGMIDKKDFTDSANARMQVECSSTCDAQADYWMSKLAPCNITDPAAMRAALVDVCTRGCDGTNPLGATNVAPDNYIVGGFNSFQDVFDHYVTNASPGGCDLNAISMPMEYGHNYTAVMDDCAILKDPADDCVNEKNNADLRKAGTGVAGVDSSACEKCIGCEELKEAVDHLKKQYSVNFIDDSYDKQEIAANVLNRYLNFNLVYEDYAQFALDCQDITTPPSTDGILNDFYNNYVFNQVQPPASPFKEKGLELPILEGWVEYNRNWFKPENQPAVLTASTDNSLAISTLPPPVPITPCMCNALQDEWFNNPNITDSATMNQELNDSCGIEVPQGQEFDFYSIYKLCEKTFNAALEAPNLNYASSYVPGQPDLNYWTSAQARSLLNKVKSLELTMPDCYQCTEPTPIQELIDELPCDTIMNFLDSLAVADPAYANIHSILRSYLGVALSENHPDRPVLEDFMREFADRFPNPFNHLGMNIPPLDANTKDSLRILRMYDKCITPPSYGYGYTDPSCCPGSKARVRTVLNFLNQLTENKGSLGNHLAYSGWNLYPKMDAYYDTYLYTQACSTNITFNVYKYTVSIHNIPEMHVEIDDGCGNKDTLILFYSGVNNNGTANTPAWNQQLDFGQITRFYDLRPYYDAGCDNSSNRFVVSYSQEVVIGGVSTTIGGQIFGYAPNWNLASDCGNKQLCDKDFFYLDVEAEDPCVTSLKLNAEYHAKEAYREYIAKKKSDFINAYRQKCRTFLPSESLTLTYQTNEYHYTLYYYDQSGNLVQTVPPKGVQKITNTGVVASSRDANTAYTPTHTLRTKYYYNSLNQLVEQNTPDGGTSQFWYDRLGRMVVSRNAEQAANNKHSYTLYDDLGRIEEVGQLDRTGGLSTTTHYIDSTTLVNFIIGGSREEVTQTFYDSDVFNLSYLGFSAQNLRSRVSAMTFESVYDGNDQTYLQGVHYTYDIHGNVNELIRENSNLASINHNYKLLKYDYDLVSGNVNSVTYQPDQRDQFIHKYNYDADNRLTQALTSQDGLHYDVDAEYFYYLHGPLMRTELGEIDVQGVDYAYTLHGWLKGVNSTSLNEARDIGQDGNQLTGNVNRFVARDVFGFSLGYYSGDFDDIGNLSTTAFAFLQTTSSGFDGASANLYNGNIKHMVTALAPFMVGGAAPQGMAYTYDQLNRISSANAWNNADLTTNSWQSGGNALPDYSTTFSYDAMGNITHLNRRGSSVTSISMDSLVYHYKPNTNQLEWVDDYVSGALHTNDIDDQASGNYTYDAIGNLTSDATEEIQDIDWTVYGKISRITRTPTSDKADLEFEYTPDGHRSLKRVYFKNPGGGVSHIEETYYIRDASGNIMATYKQQAQDFTWQSSVIYGSARLGVVEPNMLLHDANGSVSSTLPPDEIEFYRGVKRYELSNHLGNVLAVVSDKRTQICVNGTTYYEAEVIAAQDYYPFGMVIKERSWNSSNYRFGFNGQEKDDEVSGAENSYTAQFWQYDSRLGRRWNVDPKPNNTFSSYACLANNPVLFIDHEGDTIRNSFSGRGARFLNNMYRMWTTHTKVGREFKEDFSVGGKYEHITVQWTNNPWKGNETSRIIRLPDGTSQNLNYINDKSFPNLSSIASGTNTDGSSILVQININQNLVKESYFSGLLQIALALDAILHEVQHNEIALISMIRKGSIPTPYAQHMTMLNKNKKYYWQRQNQFKVFRTGWLEDYKKQKESYGFKSEQDFIDANVHEFDHQENTKGQGD